jgi:hypothetical protein
MAWSHEGSWEVCLVQRVLEVLERQSEYVDLQTGEVRRRVSFVRERSISKFDAAAGKRFDFSALADNGEFRREFLIEVHGQQHYQHTPLGEEVRASESPESKLGGDVQHPTVDSCRPRGHESVFRG